MKKSKKIMLKLLILLILVFLTYTEIARSSYLEIKTIEIKGTKQVKPKRILKLMQVNPLDNLFTYKTNNAENNILLHPKIRKVFVKKIMPDKIKVQIYERIPVAQIKINEKYLVIDKEGWLTEIKNYPQNSLVLVQGINILNYKVGQKLENSNIKVALNSMENKSYLKPYVFNLILFQGNILEIYIQGKKIILGTGENLAKKFWVLSQLLKKIQNKPVEYINIEALNYPAVKFAPNSVSPKNKLSSKVISNLKKENKKNNNLKSTKIKNNPKTNLSHNIKIEIKKQ